MLFIVCYGAGAWEGAVKLTADLGLCVFLYAVLYGQLQVGVPHETTDGSNLAPDDCLVRVLHHLPVTRLCYPPNHLPLRVTRLELPQL